MFVFTIRVNLMKKADIAHQKRRKGTQALDHQAKDLILGGQGVIILLSLLMNIIIIISIQEIHHKLLFYVRCQNFSHIFKFIGFSCLPSLVKYLNESDFFSMCFCS